MGGWIGQGMSSGEKSWGFRFWRGKMLGFFDGWDGVVGWVVCDAYG